MKAYTRSKPIRSIQYISSQSKHAWREDNTSQNRVRLDAIPGTNLSWTLQDGPSPFDPQNTPSKPDYLAAYKKYKADNGVGERKGSQLGIHILCGVSAEWIEEAGGLHDPNNPRNQLLLKTAVEWANTWSHGGVYAARLDLDETGGAVVDLFVAPTRQQHHKNGSSKAVISVNKSLEEMSLEVFGKKSKHFSALNSTWAEYAAVHLDQRLERGTPKSESGKEHIEPDAFREMMEQANITLKRAEKKEKEAEKLQAKLQEDKADFDRKMEAERVRLKQESDRRLEEERARLNVENDDKIERVVDLTVRAIVGAADGSTSLRPDGTWSLEGFSREDIKEITPFWSKIMPAVKTLSNLFSSVRNVLGKLTGIFKKEAEETIENETNTAVRHAIFTAPLADVEDDVEDDPVPDEDDYRPSGP